MCCIRNLCITRISLFGLFWNLIRSLPVIFAIGLHRLLALLILEGTQTAKFSIQEVCFFFAWANFALVHTCILTVAHCSTSWAIRYEGEPQSTHTDVPGGKRTISKSFVWRVVSTLPGSGWLTMYPEVAREYGCSVKLDLKKPGDNVDEYCFRCTFTSLKLWCRPRWRMSAWSEKN